MPARGGIIRRQRGIESPASRPLKIVVTGPFAAGKTTFIKTISEVSVLGTERGVTDATREVKSQTTVAMDFGRITLDGDLSLFLFGTPGQRRFETMWEILSEGMIGCIVLVHAADERSLEEAPSILASFREYADVPYVVGVSHLDEAAGAKEEIFEKVMHVLEVSDDAQVRACDPRDKQDVKRLLLETLLRVRARLEGADDSQLE